VFRVILSFHGYTMVAKGTVLAFVPDLRHEVKVYHQLRGSKGSVYRPAWGLWARPVGMTMTFRSTSSPMMFLSWVGDDLEEGNGAEMVR
jgi:hypothetical protein